MAGRQVYFSKLVKRLALKYLNAVKIGEQLTTLRSVSKTTADASLSAVHGSSTYKIGCLMKAAMMFSQCWFIPISAADLQSSENSFSFTACNTPTK